MKHFLSIEECHQKEILELLASARSFKADRRYGAELLSGQSWVLIFSKPSTRTRISFDCLLYTSPSPRDLSTSRMPSSA